MNDKLVREFASLSVPLIQERIRAAGAVATGKLEHSISTRVTHDANSLRHAIELTFLHYGKAMESKRRYSAGTPSGRPPLDFLVDWVKAVGLHQFDFIPNYEKKVPSLDKAARRIAYGIYFGNRSEYAKRNTYGGYIIYRPFFGLWAKYRDDIVTNYVKQTADEILDEVSSNLQFGLTGKTLRAGR